MADLTAVLAAIEAGDYDGELADLVMACRRRLVVAGRSFRWRITVFGETWDQTNVTIGEERLVEEKTGTGWEDLAPLKSAEMTVAYIAAHWHKHHGLTWNEAVEKADTLGVEEVIAAVSQFEVDRPDPKEVGPSTTS